MRTMFLLLLTPLFAFAQSSVELVQDIYPGDPSGSGFEQGVALNGILYFPARNEELGTELWSSDGTAAGTNLVTEIVPGSGSSAPMDFILADGFFYFTAQTPELGRELYRSDGTAENTVLVTDIFPGSASALPSATLREFLVWNGFLYFTAQSQTSNTELWRTDGTAQGTVLFADIAPLNPFNESVSSFPDDFTANDHFLYFTADDDENGNELWRTDGTSTVLVVDNNDSPFSSSPSGLAMLNDALYFTAEGTNGRGDLFRSDATPGSTPGAELIYDFAGDGINLSSNFSGRRVRVLNNDLIFAAEDTAGPDLWASDGTTAGTRVLLDTEEASFGGYTPQQLTPAGDFIFYKDEIPGIGIELWRTDGTPEGTILVKDLDEGFFGSFVLPSFLHEHQGRLFFSADGDVEDGFGTTGVELYVSDGTSAGTQLVADIDEGFGDSRPTDFVSVGDQLFFFATDGNTGRELYVFEGTTAPQPLVVTVDQSAQISCAGGNDGALTITVTGGTPPYTIGTVTNTDGIFIFENLEAGDYTFILTDSLDVQSTVSVQVGEPNTLNVVATQLSGQNTIEGGTIALMPLGGTPPYTFAWADTTLTTNIREDLPFGTYTATVTDANGCTFTDSYVVEDLTPVYALTANDFRIFPTIVESTVRVEMTTGLTIDRVECHDASGRLISSISGQNTNSLTLTQEYLPAQGGVYLLSVWTDDGKRGVSRIVVAAQ